MRTRWTISKKLFFLSLVNFAVLSITVGFAYYTIQSLGAQLKKIGSNDLPAVRAMALTDMIHDGLRAVVLRGFVATYQKNSSDLKESLEEYDNFSKDIESHIRKISQLNVAPATKLQSEESIVEVQRYVKAGHDILQFLAVGDINSAVKLQADYQKSFEDLEGKLEILGDLIEKETAASLSDDSARAQVISVILAVFGCTLSLIAPFLLNRNLVSTLAKIVDQMDSRKTTLQQYTVKMEASARQLNEASMKQASAMHQTAAALEEISAMVARTSENSQNLAESANESDRTADRGRHSVSTMKDDMEKIKNSNLDVMGQIDDNNTQIKKVVNVIDEIGDKTRVINEIVFQTKLLSFNASVEAARAGEHGKGFAVVAEEVGNLAQMSGNAAHQITALLAKSIKEVNDIVTHNSEKTAVLMKVNTEKVDNGRLTVDKCDESFSEVVTQVADVKRLTSEISSAIGEQTIGLREINDAVTLFGSTTQANSNAATEVAHIADQLQSQFNSVDELMQELALLVHGSRKAS